MNKFKSFVKICVLSLVFLSLNLSGAADETEAQGPNAAERAMGLALGPWNTIKSSINLVWLFLKPPNSNMDRETPTSTGAMMKDAATKSFETSKSTAEDVAKAAGDAVHRTVEKAKRSVSHSEQNPSANEDL
ncbi:uncharacterized protein [Aristolochia californica]|uniref:uncharacterized protein n=1 Tax=Aristolochia californica TaxID=171875 RepID=UPI0035DA0CF9